jgi:hypothetical protein
VFADHVLRPMIAEGTSATLGGRDRSARITFTVPDGIERHWRPQPFRARNVWVAGGHDPSGVFVEHRLGAKWRTARPSFQEATDYEHSIGR